MEQDLLDIANQDYFWPQGILRPEYLPREYEDNELLQMMEDMEPFSWFERPVDQEEVVSNLLLEGRETRQ